MDIGHLDVMFKDKLKIRELNYYKVSELPDSYLLSLEEDDATYESLWKFQEQVEITLSSKNKK